MNPNVFANVYLCTITFYRNYIPAILLHEKKSSFKTILLHKKFSNSKKCTSRRLKWLPETFPAVSILLPITMTIQLQNFLRASIFKRNFISSIHKTANVFRKLFDRSRFFTFFPNLNKSPIILTDLDHLVTDKKTNKLRLFTPHLYNVLISMSKCKT